ncbi:MAG: hypothetical protein IPN87_15760 [Saprospiraceae bacterium]|nr:hypothetical protein [Candidatus Brachybacter algidus]
MIQGAIEISIFTIRGVSPISFLNSEPIMDIINAERTPAISKTVLEMPLPGTQLYPPFEFVIIATMIMAIQKLY